MGGGAVDGGSCGLGKGGVGGGVGVVGGVGRVGGVGWVGAGRLPIVHSTGLLLVK